MLNQQAQDRTPGTTLTRECEEIEPSDLADRLVIADKVAHLADGPQQVIRLALSEGLTATQIAERLRCLSIRSGATWVAVSWSCASDWRCFTMHTDPELLRLFTWVSTSAPTTTASTSRPARPVPTRSRNCTDS